MARKQTLKKLNELGEKWPDLRFGVAEAVVIYGKCSNDTKAQIERLASPLAVVFRHDDDPPVKESIPATGKNTTAGLTHGEGPGGISLPGVR